MKKNIIVIHPEGDWWFLVKERRVCGYILSELGVVQFQPTLLISPPGVSRKLGSWPAGEESVAVTGHTNPKCTRDSHFKLGHVLYSVSVSVQIKPYFFMSQFYLTIFMLYFYVIFFMAIFTKYFCTTILRDIFHVKVLHNIFMW